MTDMIANVLRGSILKCEVCGKIKPLNLDEADCYIGGGWPKHCGQTMRLITLTEQKEKN